MAQPFIGQISMFAGNFAPLNYALCSGQLLAISQNTALFSLLGTTYGGDGVSTFALPDLRGRVPMHMGSGVGLTPRVIGQVFGTENVSLTTAQLPAHTHQAHCSTGGTTDSPVNAFAGVDPAGNVAQYKMGAANASMNAAAIGGAGSDLPHTNTQPLLAINFIIALFGVFPSRN